MSEPLKIEDFLQPEVIKLMAKVDELRGLIADCDKALKTCSAHPELAETPDYLKVKLTRAELRRGVNVILVKLQGYA